MNTKVLGILSGALTVAGLLVQVASGIVATKQQEEKIREIVNETIEEQHQA